MVSPHLQPDASPLAHPDNVIVGDTWRITMLTPSLVRLEWSARGEFCDAPSQAVWNRAFDPTPMDVRRTDGALTITTEHVIVRYDLREPRPGGFTVTCRGVPTHHAVYRYGQPPAETLPQRWKTLGGTVRTLDDADGAVDLGYGLCSRVGYAALDDSGSLVFNEQGWFAARADADAVDLYVFAYGHRFTECIRDATRLFGGTPLLPRWALGVWWSRYHRYTDAEYMNLLDEFAARDLPLSVAILDMDWHVTDPPPEQGTGWTGYTWDTECFPDPADFLRRCHERGLKVGLNLHPADGVRPFEAAHAATAAAAGVQPNQPVEFRAESAEFWDAYCKHTLHPLEELGVDFWWVDWQQGRFSAMTGLDPLWACNHVHYLDSTRPRSDGSRRRGITFSRYAGPGSNRYPIGFSGDTVISWESLAFQPEFTAAAANMAYGWWSHDIGGHLGGISDDELQTRWFQLGVYSPIFRLHSTRSEAARREPWLAPAEHERARAAAMRERHALMDYLHTMNYRNHREGIPLVTPLAWDDITNPAVYANPGQFWFGTNVLVAPAVTPRDPNTWMSCTRAYLPPGGFVDATTGVFYSGARVVNCYRTLDQYPVFYRAGAIMPTINSSGDVDITIAWGASGEFILIEDDDAFSPRIRETRLSYDHQHSTLTIHTPTGELSEAPKRRYRARLIGAARQAAGSRMGAGSLTLREANGAAPSPQHPTRTTGFDALCRALPMSTAAKEELLAIVAQEPLPRAIARVVTLDAPPASINPLLERLLAHPE